MLESEFGTELNNNIDFLFHKNNVQTENGECVAKPLNIYFKPII